MLIDAIFINAPLDRPSGDKLWECYQMMPCPFHIRLLRPAMIRILVAVREERNGATRDHRKSSDKYRTCTKPRVFYFTLQHHCTIPHCIGVIALAGCKLNNSYTRSMLLHNKRLIHRLPNYIHCPIPRDRQSCIDTNLETVYK